MTRTSSHKPQGDLQMRFWQRKNRPQEVTHAELPGKTRIEKRKLKKKARKDELSRKWANGR